MQYLVSRIGICGLLLVWLLLTAVPAAAVDLSAIRQTWLPNGLTILTLEVHAAPVVTVWTWYRVGSRNERPGADRRLPTCSST